MTRRSVTPWGVMGALRPPVALDRVQHRGIHIRRFDVPCTPFVWTDDATDGHGTAETLDEARAQIDRHLDAMERA